MDQVADSDPLFQNVDNPFSAGGATDYFFYVENYNEDQLELLATFEGDGSLNFPTGSLATILRGRRCGGNILFFTFDFQDGAGNSGFGDLVQNLGEQATVPANGSVIDVCN